jgi:hypothetical protein
MFSLKIVFNKKFFKKLLKLLYQEYLKDIMELFSHMDKLDQVRPILYLDKVQIKIMESYQDQ